jgi:putative flippase GtrA
VSAFTARARLQPARAFLRDIRSPEWGIAGQGVRFAIAGTVVAAVYITVTTVLHGVLGLGFQVALISGFTTGVMIHFTLQRVFVWRHYEKFALAIHHQALRYMGVCFVQYGLTALSTAQLPSLLGLPVELVYLVTAIGLAGLNFVLFRGRVFHPGTVT